MIFSDRMVIQREKPFSIWGEGTPGKDVSVDLQKHIYTSKVKDDGTWKVIIPPLEASFQEIVIITSEEEEIIINDVAIGEVWIAGGQSNMEFFMRYDKDFKIAVHECNNRNIRFFDYPEVAYEEQLQEQDYSLFGFWRMCDEENLQYFSAVAYYFAKELEKNLNVPIGIVGCNVGGTRACSWMDEDTVRKNGLVWLEDYEKGLLNCKDLKAAENAFKKNPFNNHTHPFDNQQIDKMMYGMSLEELRESLSKFSQEPEEMVIGPWHDWRPCGLYHTMLKKIIPYSARGVIWYQGESDVEHPEIYADMMCGLISCWRRDWDDELPFIMTQLAPLGTLIGEGGLYFPVIREQQEETVQRMKNVFCASIGDVGSIHDIHPKEKQPVGRRMALLARGHVYKEDILCEAPVVECFNHKKDVIEIIFKNAQDGLVVKGNRVNAVKIYGESDCLLSEETYSVSVNENKIIIQIQPGLVYDNFVIEFAKEPYYEINVYNKSDIPIKPFKLIKVGSMKYIR